MLFFARTVMAFQFQSVAALSPLIVESLAITLVDIGLLIGLYLGPGVIVALLGGTLANRIGDWRTVLFSLILMIAGSILISQSSTLNGLLAGRILSGIGGVIVNVVMTKMVIDWFAGRNIATAMAVFISSWPMGIGLALVILPALASSGGVGWGWAGVTIATTAALALFVIVYRAPPGTVAARAELRVTSLPWMPLIMAGVIWALYNAALAMIFGFGPIVLAERGATATSASFSTSLFMFAIVFSAPLGGWLADKFARRDGFILVSLLAAIIIFPAMIYLPLAYAPLGFVLAGIIVGLAPGPMVSLPAAILSPDNRAFGTGIYYSIYYALMLMAPPLAGAIAEFVENANAAFIIAAVMMAGAAAALFVFRRSAKPAAA